MKYLLSIYLLLSFAFTGHAQGIPEARKLMALSIEANDGDLRLYYRGLLARKFPDTAYGQFALGAISAANGDNTAAMKYYQQALEINPRIPAALNNLALNDPQQIKLLEQAAEYGVEQDPLNAEYYIRNLVRTVLDASDWNDARKQRYMLDKLKAVNEPAHQIAYYHLRAINERDDNKALALMVQASDHGYSRDSLKAEIDLRVKVTRQNRGDINAIFSSLNEINKKLNATGGRQRHGAVLYELYYLELTKLALQHSTHPQLLMNLASSAYNERRSPAVIDVLYRAHLYANMGDFKKYLDGWTRTTPDNPIVQIYVSMWSAYHLKDYATSINAAKKAIGDSPTNGIRDKAIWQALQTSIEFGQIKQGLTLMQTLDQSMSPALVDSQLMLLMLDQQFGAAQALVERADAQGVDVSRAYRVLAERGAQDANERQRIAKNNPFLRQWDKDFGTSLSLAFRFGVNSATIPANAHATLNRAAAALTQPGAEPYIFRIEGHTDPSGGNRINIPLSDARANAVKSYLMQTFNIEPGRLQAVGMGDVMPTASNTTEEGRQRNRRVEILPYGNISEPELSTAGYLDDRSTVFSRDGRYAAAGQFPIALWDLQQGVRLRELYIGGDHRSFSPNSRYLAALSSATDLRGVQTAALYITDTKTGLFHMIVPFMANQPGTSLSWSPEGNRLAVINSRGILTVIDVEHSKILSATPLGSTRISGELHWSKAGNALYVGYGRDTELTVLDPDTLKLVKTIPGINWTHAIGQSDDASTLIVANNDRTLSLIDANDQSLIKRLRNPVSTPANILAIPGTTKVLMDDKFGKKTVSVFDYQTGAFQASEPFESNVRIGVSPDGSVGYIASGNAFDLLDLETLNHRPIVVSSANRAHWGLTRDTKNDYLFISDSQGASVWHLGQGRMVHRIDEAGALPWKQLQPGATEWWSISKAGEILKFNTDDFIVRRHKGVTFEPGHFYLSANHIAITQAKQPRASTGKLAVFDRNTLSRKYETDIKLVTEPLRHPGGVIEAGIHSAVLDEKSGRIGVVTWWNNGNYARPSSSNIQVFNLSDGKPAGRDLLMHRSIESLLIEPSDGNAYAKDLFYTYRLNLANSSWESGVLRDWEVTDIGQGQQVLWGTFFLQNGQTRRHVKDGIWGLTGDASRNVVVTLSEGNQLTYYDLKTLEPRFSVQFRADGQWLATDNRGYFTSSIHGTRGAFWNLGDNYLPFDALREKYENDRAVRESLANLFLGKSADNARPTFDADVIDMPFEVQLVSARELTTKDDSYRLKITVKKQTKHAQDPSMHFLVNGRRSRGFDQDPFADLDETLTFVRTVPLSVGENRIEAIINYKGVDVYREIAMVTRQAESKVALQEGTLWFFGVGVSEYTNTLQNLDFADRDALELEKLFLAQKGRLFQDVRTKVLTNGKATARDIRIALYDFFAESKPTDQIVIFIAGHGIQDASQALYFMPHDGDMKRPFTGMPMEDFRRFLEQRPLNQRALFLLDICHAGAFDNTQAGRLTSEDVIKQLATGTATTVFSSSTGAQKSLEDERFGGGHGAFTYSLLKGMRGYADKETGDLDGVNSLLEVILYSRREVPRLTDQAQTPTVPVLSNFDDYALSAAVN